jgi:hypothetical protein
MAVNFEFEIFSDLFPSFGPWPVEAQLPLELEHGGTGRDIHSDTKLFQTIKTQFYVI